MKVCCKACGVRLLSSQRERRGKKKPSRKPLLAFVFKGNAPPVCILPFLGGSLWSSTPRQIDAIVCYGGSGEGGQALWEHVGQLVIHEWGALSWKGLLSKSFPRASSDTPVQQVFPCPGSVFPWWPENIGLQLEDKSPTWQKNPISPGIFRRLGLGLAKLAS